MSGSLVRSGSGVGPSGDPAPTAPLQAGLLQFLTGTYNLTPGDNNKYLVCSGGSWNLGLPTPAVGLSYRVRNDQGITGTTGTITITPASGTIDGLASLALLPGQQCTIYTDGTNWRTFELQRVVVIGTIDITVAVASQTVLLPIGYRIFELDLYGWIPSVDRTVPQIVFSIDGGSTFAATGYYTTYLFGASATTPAFQANSNIAYGVAGATSRALATFGMQSHLRIYPGDGNRAITWHCHGEGHDSTAAIPQEYVSSGALYNLTSIANAAKVYFSSGNINAGSIVVRGIV